MLSPHNANHSEPHHVGLHLLPGVPESSQRLLLHHTRDDVRCPHWVVHFLLPFEVLVQANGHSVD